MKKSDFLIVYCQHGDEKFGVLVAAEVNAHSIDSLLANPRAFMVGKRYIDSDLNRSFNSNQAGYEQRRARELITIARKYKYVIDIHASKASVGRVAIVTSDSPFILRLCRRLGFRRAVIMPKKIIKHGLIGNVSLGISLEYGSDARQDTDEAKHLIYSLTTVARLESSDTMELYYVKDIIDQKYRHLALKNYTYNPQIKGYPFLVGESGYKDYLGFFADRKETVIIEADD